MKQFDLILTNHSTQQDRRIRYQLADSELARTWADTVQTASFHVGTSLLPKSVQTTNSWNRVRLAMQFANNDAESFVDDWFSVPAELPLHSKCDIQDLFNRLRVRCQEYEEFCSCHDLRSRSREELRRVSNIISTNLEYSLYTDIKAVWFGWPMKLTVPQEQRVSELSAGDIAITAPAWSRTYTEARRADDFRAVNRKLIRHWNGPTNSGIITFSNISNEIEQDRAWAEKQSLKSGPDDYDIDKFAVVARAVELPDAGQLEGLIFKGFDFNE